MPQFDDDLIDLMNVTLHEKREAEAGDEQQVGRNVVLSQNQFIRLMTTAQQNFNDMLQFQAYHETEKAMRQHAEDDLGKFRKLIGRLFWQVK